MQQEKINAISFTGDKGKRTLDEHRVLEKKCEQEAVLRNQPQVPVVFPSSPIDNILVSGRSLLANNMENAIFVAEQFDLKEGEEQAAFLWHKIPKNDTQTIRRMEKTRQSGQVKYIDPEEHPGAAGIFYGQHRVRETECAFVRSAEWEKIPGTEDFAYSDGWLWSLESGEEKAFKLVNTRIWVDKICKRISHSGETKELVWNTKVSSFTSKEIVEWEIPQEKVAVDFLSKLRNVPGVCFANGVRVANSLLNFVRIQAALAPEENTLCEKGWQEVDGKLVYVFDGRVLDSYLIRTGKHIRVKADNNPADIFMKMLQVFRDKTLAGPLLAYSVYGLLHHVFTSAGILPQTIMFLCGSTGCRKTSLAKILFRFFDDEIQSAPHSFQSSLGSLDDLVNQGRDGTLLLDDFCPNNGNSDAKEMFEKLERIVRLYGDGSSRKVLNSNHEAYVVAEAQGGAVITGEVQGQGKSSLLRMLTIEMDYYALDLEKMSEFQEDKQLWPTFIAAFINEAEENYDQIQKCLVTTYREQRKMAQPLFKDGRVCDHYAVLMGCTRILLQFLQRHQIGSATILGLSTQFEDGIRLACEKNEDLANDKTAWSYYVEAVYQVLLTDIPHIASCKVEFDRNPGLLGYRGKKGSLYVKVDVIERHVKDFLSKKGKEANFMKNSEAFNILAEKGIIKVYNNGQGKRSFTISAACGGASNRLVQIYPDRLHDEMKRLS